jgi:catechol 2,3-dioxygenase-like lactoylglutathione lyase family enzyme
LEDKEMIGKGIFHTNIAVRDVSKSMNFYQGLFGLVKADLEDGDLVFLTTPGHGDVLTLTPAGGTYGFPGGCAIEMERERRENRPSVQGGMSHFGYMLHSREEYENVVARVIDFGGRLLTRYEHGGTFSRTYLADPDGYTVQIHYVI